ncbi:glycosyltransferase [Streptomyces sp. YIM 130001]|uniref:glycosyltransferase family 2 protein n=1 Tax=Streptomyces sp. YIM 130001 TaxID=2259644 RepID=UPI001F091786|nr:glycosyltransferase [Streptomyces sp. YIM 130001]
MTSHNRRAATLSALDSLARQRGLPPGTVVRVHFVDAGSTDGTPEAVRRAHPEAEVMTVAADVFWGHGMRIASRNSRAAGAATWTHQLWLGDAVTLDPDALAELLALDGKLGSRSVVVGALRSADGTRTTYSGRRGRALDLVEPTDAPEPCDTYNGKVVLVPYEVRALTGDIDAAFPHGMGDYDHGLRARRAGVRAYVAPGHLGVCDGGPPRADSREPGIGVREALRRVTSPRELPPRAWWLYCLRHGRPWTPFLMLAPYARTALRAGAGHRTGRR